jgi:hypothetical protein
MVKKKVERSGAELAYVVEDNIIAKTFAFGIRMTSAHECAKNVATFCLSSSNEFFVAFHETAVSKP